MTMYQETISRAVPRRVVTTSPIALLRHEDRQLQRMLKVGFVFFLVWFALLRLVPRRWRPGAAEGEHQSIAAQARDAAGTYITLAFGGC